MNALGLVGMTMGARKRAARDELAPVDTFCMACRRPLRGACDLVEPAPGRAAQFIDPECSACPYCGDETDGYYPDEIPAATRRYWRIGQRLRPCPPGGCGGRGTVDDDGRDAPCPICNGTRVVPAGWTRQRGDAQEGQR